MGENLFNAFLPALAVGEKELWEDIFVVVVVGLIGKLGDADLRNRAWGETGSMELNQWHWERKCNGRRDAIANGK